MTLFHRPDRISDPLYVVTVVFNPQRYRARWKLYEDFKFIVDHSGAILYTVEVAFGQRDLVLQDIAGPNYLGLRSSSEIWLKENALNLGFARLPSDWKYAGWLDADVSLARGDWANEIIHALQHYQVIQPFSVAFDLDPSYEPLREFKSFANCFVNKQSLDKSYYYGGEPGKVYPHPGFGMFFRRGAFDNLGGLIDWAVLGGADLYMWHLLTGTLREWPWSLGKTGVQKLKVWGARADKYIKRNVGYINGLLLHYWHGNKKQRKYKDRGQILVRSKFNPDNDIYRDYQGLWQLRDDNLLLRDGIREYFQGRNEDSTDVL